MVKVGEEVEIVGYRRRRADGGDGCGDVSQDFGSGSGGGQHWGVASGGEAGRDRAGAGVGEAGFDHAAHEV